MMYHEECFALIFELLENRHNGCLGGGIHAGERFIHEIQITLLCQRSR